MDRDLKYYLISLDFEDADINHFIKLAPALKITPYGHAMDNIMEVVKRGYPMDDIDSLIMVNPGFLTLPTQSLIDDLNKIEGNIEKALKSDPFLI